MNQRGVKRKEPVEHPPQAFLLREDFIKIYKGVSGKDRKKDGIFSKEFRKTGIVRATVPAYVE